MKLFKAQKNRIMGKIDRMTLSLPEVNHVI